MQRFYLLIGMLIIIGLSIISLFTGVTEISFNSLWSEPALREIFIISRVPRTIALLLAGSAVSVAGLIMQLLIQNRFVEPSLAGTTQSASLGLLLVLIIAPSAPIIVKMIVASVFAMFGTAIFMFILHKIVLKSALVVPLVGIMLGSVIGSITVFIAFYYDLLQSLGAWVSGGDFSGIIQGRYELLWLVGFLTLLAYWFANRFTAAGMGQEFAINIGLNYRQVIIIGLSIIAIVSGIITVVVGALPFLGLIVPNIVALIIGDNTRKAIPWVCLLGGGIVLLCDIIGRIISYPFELPASTILGVIGAITFLFLLIHQSRYAKH